MRIGDKVCIPRTKMGKFLDFSFVIEGAESKQQPFLYIVGYKKTEGMLDNNSYYPRIKTDLKNKGAKIYILHTGMIAKGGDCFYPHEVVPYVEIKIEKTDLPVKKNKIVANGFTKREFEEASERAMEEIKGIEDKKICGAALKSAYVKKRKLILDMYSNPIDDVVNWRNTASDKATVIDKKIKMLQDTITPIQKKMNKLIKESIRTKHWISLLNNHLGKRIFKYKTAGRM
jgi:hypothetical protein